MPADEHPVTEALRRLSSESGTEATASEELLDLVYKELHELAQSMMARERPGHTLQPTALVHEAYLNILGTQAPKFEGRAHFFAAAAESMRRILIDQARRKGRAKRGGNMKRADIDVDLLAIESPGEDVLAVDEALEQLEKADPRARKIINLRYFAGFSNQETADLIGTSIATVEREWRFIKVWLRNTLQGPDPGLT